MCTPGFHLIRNIARSLRAILLWVDSYFLVSFLALGEKGKWRCTQFCYERASSWHHTHGAALLRNRRTGSKATLKCDILEVWAPGKLYQLHLAHTVKRLSFISCQCWVKFILKCLSMWWTIEGGAFHYYNLHFPHYILVRWHCNFISKSSFYDSAWFHLVTYLLDYALERNNDLSTGRKKSCKPFLHVHPLLNVHSLIRSFASSLHLVVRQNPYPPKP